MFTAHAVRKLPELDGAAYAAPSEAPLPSPVGSGAFRFPETRLFPQSRHFPES